MQFPILDSLRAAFRKRNKRSLARPLKKPVRLSVEALEDRLVLSTAPTPALVLPPGTPPPQTNFFAFSNVPTSVTAGVSFSVTVTEYAFATDKVVSTGGVSSAALSVSPVGVATTEPLGSVSLVAGVGKATLTLSTAESVELYATSGSMSNLKTYVAGSWYPLVVNPGPATHFLVSAGGTETAGVPFKVAITAEDGNNNVATSYNQSPAFTASYGYAASASGVVTWSNGVGTATVTLNNPGSTTLTAAAGTVKGVSNSITVNGASQFIVSSQSTETVGVPFQVTIKAEDKNGVIVPTYDQSAPPNSPTATLTASDGYTVSASGITWSNGVGTATVTLNNPGVTTLTAVAGLLEGVSNSITVDAFTTTGSPWSGYAVAPTSGVTAVGGSWVQPAVSGPGNSASSMWVGIDGYNGSTVEQIGIATSMVNGVPVYTPWIEFFGDGNLAAGVDAHGNPINHGADYFQTNINTLPGYSSFTVHAGDAISAEVSLVSGTSSTFLFQMTDTPKGGGAVETFSLRQTMQYVVPARSTAEWIVENPNKAVQPLADFILVNFTGAWATIGAKTGPINGFSDVIAVNLSSSEGKATVINPPTVSKTLGYNEPAGGVSTSSFLVTWGGGANGTANSANGTVAETALAGRVNSASADFGTTPVNQAAEVDAVFSALGSAEHVPGNEYASVPGGTHFRDMLFALEEPGFQFDNGLARRLLAI